MPVKSSKSDTNVSKGSKPILKASEQLSIEFTFSDPKKDLTKIAKPVNDTDPEASAIKAETNAATTPVSKTPSMLTSETTRFLKSLLEENIRLKQQLISAIQQKKVVNTQTKVEQTVQKEKTPNERSLASHLMISRDAIPPSPPPLFFSPRNPMNKQKGYPVSENNSSPNTNLNKNVIPVNGSKIKNRKNKN